MRCKVGDLAVVVGSDCNDGKIVRCQRVVQRGRILRVDGRIVEGPVWIVEPQLISWDGETVAPHVPDSYLRPIRDNPGADETLTWAGKPERVTA